jgi:Thioredoxin
MEARISPSPATDAARRTDDCAGAAELSDKLIVAKVNVDENQVTAQRYGILALPTLQVFNSRCPQS